MVTPLRPPLSQFEPIRNQNEGPQEQVIATCLGCRHMGEMRIGHAITGYTCNHPTVLVEQPAIAIGGAAMKTGVLLARSAPFSTPMQFCPVIHNKVKISS